MEGKDQLSYGPWLRAEVRVHSPFWKAFYEKLPDQNEVEEVILETPPPLPLLLPAAPSYTKEQPPYVEINTTQSLQSNPLPTLHIPSMAEPLPKAPQQHRLQSFRDLLNDCALMDLDTKGCAFESFWLQDDECHRVVSEAWSSTSCHPFSISKKLQLTTTALSQWSRRKFTAGHQQIDLLKQHLQYHINQPDFETIAALLWQIWKARNHFIFRHQLTKPDQLVDSALALAHLDPTDAGHDQSEYRWCFSYCRKLGCDLQRHTGSSGQSARRLHQQRSSKFCI